MYHDVVQELQKLRKWDKGLKIFGAKSHKYSLNPVLSEDCLLGFEKQHGIQLPNDYRTFLREVGNGGAGPYYGMYKLQNFYMPRFYDGSDASIIDNNFLQTPFPYSENKPFPECDGIADLSDEEFVKRLCGTITLAHQGCGYYDMLIVSGEEKGKVWTDATVSDYGMGRSFASFTEWYLHWIKESIEKCDKPLVGRFKFWQ